MSEHGKLMSPGEVRFVRRLPGTPERVWQYLVDPEKRRTWLAAGAMELWVGGRVELKFQHAELTPFGEKPPPAYAGLEHGHTMIGRVTRCEAPQVLSYTWGEEDDEEPASEVIFEIRPADTGVELILTHRRIASRGTMKGISTGWHTHLDVLGIKLAGEPVPRFWPMFEANAAHYQQALADAPVAQPRS